MRVSSLDFPVAQSHLHTCEDARTFAGVSAGGRELQCIQSEEIPTFHETWRVAAPGQMRFSSRHLSSLTLSHQQAIVTGGFNAGLMRFNLRCGH
jgi:hypothetical protein